VTNGHRTQGHEGVAPGHGTFWENDCTPNCADGHVHYYPSLEVLWGSAPVKGHPADRRYTKLTVIFTGKTRPPVYVLKNGKPVATYPLTQTFDAIEPAGGHRTRNRPAADPGTGPSARHVTETIYRHAIVPAIKGGTTVLNDMFGHETNAG